MSLAGFKKQLNKANQLLNEKIAGAKGTELESDFVEMERKIDVTGKLIEEVVSKTQDYLQPNPMARARITAVKGLNNLQNKNRSMAYPQPEGVLGDAMVRHGKDLGHNSSLGSALVDCGEAYKQMAEIKYNLEDSVKQNFLDPFNSMLQQDLKEINHHRKKLEGRRLDFDCKKRKGTGKGNEEELHAAEEKFAESKSLAETAMANFLSSDAEQVSALYELVSAEQLYHQEAGKILAEAKRRLDEKRSEAAGKPKATSSGATAVSATARVRASGGDRGSSDSWSAANSGGGASASATAGSESAEGGAAAEGGNGGPTISIKPRHQSATKTATPTCRALFTFTADNKTELAFEEGDVIQLVSQVDDNWYEGELKGKRGFFPVNYVDVIVPLP